jgi:hypothetical protein
LRFIAFDLAFVGPSQTDHVHFVAAWREYQHVQSAVDYTQCLVSALAIVSPRVLGDERRIPFEFGRRFERDAARCDISRVLGSVEADAQLFIVYTYIQ